MKIPVLDLKPGIASIHSEIISAINSVVDNTQFIGGEQVEGFESESGTYLGTSHTVSCNSGTDAIILALRALDIGPGDEVIAPSFSFFATAETISLVGATPVFADIDPVTFNICPKNIEKLITPKTKAIIPVHLFGQPADMDDIIKLAQEHKLSVIEDSAQSFGASYKNQKAGTIGDFGTYSFFPSKNLGCFGDGGMVTCKDDAHAKKMLLLRQHGSKIKYQNEMIGYNSRLDAIQAAVLRVKLKHIDENNRKRAKAAQRYNELLSNIDWIITPTVAEDRTHIYHQYTIRVLGGQRDVVRENLAANGIGTMVYYPTPIHSLPVYNAKIELPNTSRAAAEVLSLPMWPEITEDTQSTILKSIKKALT